MPWVILVRRETLTGRRPYVALHLTSFAFWLATLHFLTLPHWATSFGLLAIAFYLAFYFPLFVALARNAVHALGVSAVLAVPVVWTGLEFARLHMFTGFGMALLSHTQYCWPLVLQVSDIFGAYGVSFAMIFVTACAGRMLPCGAARWAWWPIVPLAAMLAAVLAYGNWRLTDESAVTGPKVALIQGSIDVEIKHDSTQSQRIFDEYFGLSRQAVKEHPDVELLIWPETMFPYPWYLIDEGFQAPDDAPITPEEAKRRSRDLVAGTARALGKPILLGISTYHGTRDGMRSYNSGLFVDRQGNELGRYDKNHLVLFGEYVPFAETFPWLYRLTPLPGGLNRGDGPRAVQIGQTRYAPNICYENTVPHLLRQHVIQLRHEEREPDVLVTLTNDGWFWGSSELDLHLACGVFRAIECRKPMLIAANTGFSAWIDADGHIRSQGPRRSTDVVIAETKLDRRGSWYLDHGDLGAGLCLSAACGLAIVGVAGWRRERKKQNAAES